MKVRYSYLSQQFGNCPDLWVKLKKFVATGDFTLGKPLKEFEDNFAKLIGSKYAVGVNSGTDAIKLSLKTLGVGHGDEVITTSFSWISTAEVIVNLGAKPVFIDVDQNTGLIKEKLIEKMITKKTKAIIIVSLFGQIPNIEFINLIGKKYKIPIIEDAAQSFGSKFKNKYAGLGF